MRYTMINQSFPIHDYRIWPRTLRSTVWKTFEPQPTYGMVQSHSLMKKKDKLLAFYEVRYEDILKNPEEEIFKIFEFCELPEIRKDNTEFWSKVSQVGVIHHKNVYGDFDVDGITGTALLVYGLTVLGGNAVPYIPHRLTEGYGLKTTALEKLHQQGVSLPQHRRQPLLYCLRCQGRGIDKLYLYILKVHHAGQDVVR